MREFWGQIGEQLGDYLGGEEEWVQFIEVTASLFVDRTCYEVICRNSEVLALSLEELLSRVLVDRAHGHTHQEK